VVSSSFKSFPRVAPGSPFAAAIQELFVDAALRNITLLLSAGDGGSGDQYANGLTNIAATHDSPFGLVVGGASFSTVQSASLDETLNGASAAFADIFAAAMAGDPATVWQLVAGGLKALPSAAAADDKLLETAWNACVVAVDSLNADRDFMSPGYMNDFAGSGGVDPTQPQPWYQTAFGLDLRTADPAALPGRGVPDVSAASGGNMFYLVPGSTMAGTELVAGTSAAAPL
jgi:subtilase family serine protease